MSSTKALQCRAFRYTIALKGGFGMKDEGKKQTAFRLSAEARRLLGVLSEKLGVTQAAVVEIAIREKAQKEDAA